MTDALSDFLKAAARRPFSLSAWDCGRFCGAWLACRRGVDPSAQWASHYSTPLGLARLIKRRGGMVAHFNACLAPLGIARTESPQRGDIAIVDTFGGEIGAIVLGKTVVMLSGPGTMGITTRHRSVAPILAAWSI